MASAVSCLLIGSDRRDGDPPPPNKRVHKFLGFVKPHGASEKSASSNCFKGIPFIIWLKHNNADAETLRRAGTETKASF